MQRVDVSWSRIRRAYERRGAPRESTQKKSVPEAFFRGNLGDTLTRVWLADPSNKMSDLIDICIDQTASDTAERGRSNRWLTQNKINTIKNDFIPTCDRLEGILRQHVLPYEFEVPKRFDVLMPYNDLEIHLIGEMDIFFKSKFGYGILDLKITDYKDYWRSSFGQIVFYDIAASIMCSGNLIKAGLVQPLYTDGLVEFQINQQDRREMIMNIIRYASTVTRVE